MPGGSDNVAVPAGEHPFSVPVPDCRAEPMPGPATLCKKENASAWDLDKFIAGIEQPERAPAAIIARLLKQARPAGSFNDDFAWCQHLAQNPSQLKQALSQPALVEQLARGLGEQMSLLLTQKAATAAELNDKFCTDSNQAFTFGDRSLFDDGLSAWIGAPNSTDPMLEVTCIQGPVTAPCFMSLRRARVCLSIMCAKDVRACADVPRAQRPQIFGQGVHDAKLRRTYTYKCTRAISYCPIASDCTCSIAVMKCSESVSQDMT